MWKIVNYQEKGTSHKKNNLPCQDKTFVLKKNNVYSASLSDGAGSCELSHKGAEIVTKKVCNILCDNFEHLYKLDDLDVAKKIMANCILEIKKISIDEDINKYSSTLLFVAVKENKFIAGHLGDGVIGFSENEIIKVLSKPQNGEYINSTYFITNTNNIDKFKIYKGYLEDIDGFILMSDGVSDSLYNRKEEVLVNSSLDLINWLDDGKSSKIKKSIKSIVREQFIRRTSDDCSIVLMKLKKA